MLFKIAENNPDGFKQYLPPKAVTVKEAVEPYLKSRSKSTKFFAVMAFSCFDDDVDESEAITDFDDLMKFVREAEADDKVMEEEFEYYTEGSGANVIEFLKKVEEDLNSGKLNIDRDLSEDAVEQVVRARRQLMADYEKWDSDEYTHQGEEAEKVTLIPADRKQMKASVKEAFNNGEGSRTVEPGQSVVIKVPLEFYDYM